MPERLRATTRAWADRAKERVASRTREGYGESMSENRRLFGNAEIISLTTGQRERVSTNKVDNLGNPFDVDVAESPYIIIKPSASLKNHLVVAKVKTTYVMPHAVNNQETVFAEIRYFEIGQNQLADIKLHNRDSTDSRPPIEPPAFTYKMVLRQGLSNEWEVTEDEIETEANTHKLSTQFTRLALIKAIWKRSNSQLIAKDIHRFKDRLDEIYDALERYTANSKMNQKVQAKLKSYYAETVSIGSA